mmetsp:Transcript_69005/g.183878  ORF Transcript_69005/g.183878 Transcript_69005/m.183878 type:complete len:344 (-) Transcript_69005:421-1452(-)
MGIRSVHHVLGLKGRNPLGHSVVLCPVVHCLLSHFAGTLALEGGARECGSVETVERVLLPALLITSLGGCFALAAQHPQARAIEIPRRRRWGGLRRWNEWLCLVLELRAIQASNHQALKLIVGQGLGFPGFLCDVRQNLFAMSHYILAQINVKLAIVAHVGYEQCVKLIAREKIAGFKLARAIVERLDGRFDQLSSLVLDHTGYVLEQLVFEDTVALLPSHVVLQFAARQHLFPNLGEVEWKLAVVKNVLHHACQGSLNLVPELVEYPVLHPLQSGAFIPHLHHHAGNRDRIGKGKIEPQATEDTNERLCHRTNYSIQDHLHCPHVFTIYAESEQGVEIELQW